MRRVLVTGVTGFAGSHLVDFMLERGDVEIWGLIRWRSRTENIEHFRDRIQLFECDLRDAESTRDAKRSATQESPLVGGPADSHAVKRTIDENERHGKKHSRERVAYGRAGIGCQAHRQLDGQQTEERGELDDRVQSH